MWLVTLSPLVALGVNVVMQIISVHLNHRIALSVFIGLFSGLMTNGVLLTRNFLSVEDGFISLFTYLALSFCYWAFLNLNRTSLRIRIVRELGQEKEKKLNMETLLERYSFQELINRRIERLEKAGQIIKREGKWVIQSRKFFIFLWVSTFLRKLIIPAN